MQENLKQYLERNEADRKQFLRMYHIGTRLQEFGKNALLLFFSEQSKVELFVHLFILLIVGASFPAWLFLKVHIGSNLGLYALGKFYFRRIWGRKLDDMQLECQERLNEFADQQYQEKRIVKNRELCGGDYVVFGDDTVVKNNCILSSIEAGCDPVSIYCLADSSANANYNCNRPNFTDMKSKVASLEFNKRFGVLVKKNWEREGMKFLSPTRQLNMIRSTDFEDVSEITIENGRVKVTMPKEHISRPYTDVNVYFCQALEKPFKEVANYCTSMRVMADRMYGTYTRVAEILQD